MAAILFEHPLDELTGNLLRVDTLFSRVDVLINRFFSIDHHFCLLTLLEIADLEEQFNLNEQILKEFEAQKNRLKMYRGNPQVAASVLEDMLAKLEAHGLALKSQKKRLAHVVADDEWLFKLRDRMGLPGGTAPFDAPKYFAWQQRSGEDRRADLLAWLDHFLPFRQSAAFLLNLMRDNAICTKQMARGGEFRQSIPQGKCKLIQIWVDPKLKTTPEVQGNKLMVTIRFIDRGPMGQTSACLDDIPFELGLVM
ncbi:MAG: cell division protein ZapD [Betaproteobacteria bacterium]|nr:cell division protein ZapD [Betaproteobacteria bacterium]NBZ99257.1 cell division protein ZapD [Betaproteobacteria bacterium]NDB44939.1 cell division protein ZapD [Betaproteobacteria bacterium]NDD23903.1 cell division protein ZapD [Betaproteobacteria bacterium]NDE24773.1 cell division protein ZapD [Betaproteobacteria bacterium]